MGKYRDVIPRRDLLDVFGARAVDHVEVVDRNLPALQDHITGIGIRRRTILERAKQC